MIVAAARLLEINPKLDRRKLAASFSDSKRIQVRNVLTPASAQRIATLLAQETPWGLCWNAGLDGPHRLRAEQVNALPQAAIQGMLGKVSSAMQAGNFAFIYSQYLMNDAKVLGWSRSPKHDSIVDDLNSPPFLDLAREVTGIPELKWADSQATLYGPGQFLSMHQDVAEGEARRIAYVLNFCSDAWRPDWGGYLNFYDKEGDIVAGYKPRFNSLNMFLIPQDHNVSFVPGFAPHARFAITGWLRDK